jgi:hypothetical protein
LDFAKTVSAGNRYSLHNPGNESCRGFSFRGFPWLAILRQLSKVDFDSTASLFANARLGSIAEPMRKLLLLFTFCVLSLTTASAAISVGADGSGVISFAARPPAAEWSTKSISGADTSFATVDDLLNAVQTNGSASITNQLLDGAGANPPGQNTLAAWTTGGTSSLWTRPTANAATLLMATLVNTSGVDQPILRIVYTLGESGSTPAEQTPAHQVYYSLSGLQGTWINIPALSGGGTGVKSNTVVLGGNWGIDAQIYVLWVDDNAPGGVDRGYSIDDISFAGNTRPTLALIPEIITDVLRPVRFKVPATDAEANQLTYLLEPGAPATARINDTNGVFLWVPTRANAATTNTITIRATEVGSPLSALYATRSFTIVVRDYVELSVGSVVTDVGQRTNVLIEFVSTAPLTNLTFAVQLPSAKLTDLAVEDLVPWLVWAALDTSQPDRAVFTFTALPGQSLAGTQQLARLHFTVAAGQRSAFLPLQPGEVVAQRAEPGLEPSVLLNSGRVVAVDGEPLLEALRNGGVRIITVYGRPGTNYMLEISTNFPALWQPWQSLTLSSLVGSIDASAHTNLPLIFYRARAAASSLPPLTSTKAKQNTKAQRPARKRS